MAHQHVISAVFVVHGELVHHRGAGFIHANDFDLCGFTAKFDDHFVQGTDRRYVPKVGAAYVNADFLNDFLEVGDVSENGK